MKYKLINTPGIIYNFITYPLSYIRHNTGTARMFKGSVFEKFSVLFFLFNVQLKAQFKKDYNPIMIKILGLNIWGFHYQTLLILFREVFEPRNNSCPITLEPFQENEAVTMIKYCGHLFKTDEINQWFETNVRCPVCRYDLRNYREPTNTINRLLPTEMRSNNIRGNSNSIRRNVNSIRRNVNSTSNSNSALNQLFTSLMETTNTDVSNNYV